jgi:diguanylate cyclase (GGDEF)-like protein
VEIAERVRKGIEDMRILSGGYKLSVTISGGVAFRRQKESLESVIERADTALYKAKENGRNCIETIEHGGTS